MCNIDVLVLLPSSSSFVSPSSLSSMVFSSSSSSPSSSCEAGQRLGLGQGQGQGRVAEPTVFTVTRFLLPRLRASARARAVPKQRQSASESAALSSTSQPGREHHQPGRRSHHPWVCVQRRVVNAYAGGFLVGSCHTPRRNDVDVRISRPAPRAKLVSARVRMRFSRVWVRNSRLAEFSTHLCGWGHRGKTIFNQRSGRHKTQAFLRCTFLKAVAGLAR